MLGLLFFSLVAFAQSKTVLICNDDKKLLEVEIKKLSNSDSSGNEIETIVRSSSRNDIIVRGFPLSVGSNLVYKSQLELGFDGPKEDDGVFESFRVTISDAENIKQGQMAKANFMLRQYEYEKKFFCDKVDNPPIPRDENDPIVIKHKCKRWDLVRQPLKSVEITLNCQFIAENPYSDFCKNKSQTEIQSLLFFGAQNQEPNLVEQMLACNANINMADSDGCTPLMMSVSTQKMTCSSKKELLADTYRMAKSRFIYNMVVSNGAYLDLQDATGESAMHKVIRAYNVPVLRDMIALEADLNVQDNTGTTPIMLAAEIGSAKMIRALVEGGADLGLKDNKGQTAYDRGKNLPEDIRELLLDAKVVLTIEGQSDGKCSPLDLSAPVNEIVKVVLKSANGKMFMLSVPKANISLMAEGGKTAAKTLQFKQAGVFDFQCGVHGGSQSSGKLTIK